MSDLEDASIKFYTASQVAKFLSISTKTLKNREDTGVYPAPWRDPINNYRKYSVLDVLRLQILTFQQTSPVAFLESFTKFLSKKYPDMNSKQISQKIISILDLCYGRLK